MENHNRNGDADTSAAEESPRNGGQEQRRHTAEKPETSEPKQELSTERAEEPDVFLDVPNLSVDEITLNLESLNARVSLHAAVGNMVTLDVGADAQLGHVELSISGVHAEALLKVRLARVYDILARTLATVEQNPQLLAEVLRPAGELTRDIGQSAKQALPEATRSARLAGIAKKKWVPDFAKHPLKTVGKKVRQRSQDGDAGSNIAHKIRETVGRRKRA